MINNNNNKTEINLFDGEKLLFKEKANILQIDKQLGRVLLIFLVLIVFWIFDIKMLHETVNMITTIITITLSIITICVLYGLLYNLIFVKKHRNNIYYVTNKRLIIINNNGMIERNISDLERVGISREKNNYGTITFNFCANTFVEQIKNSIGFDGINNPRDIVKSICEIKNDIHIYDDNPTGIFVKRGK